MTLQQILQELRKPVDPKYISVKKVPTKKGEFTADYIHHADIRDLLDERAPGWSSERAVFHAGGKLYVRVTLTLIGSDGTCVRSGLGCEDDDEDGYGDPSSNADAMALRRAAMDAGLAREMWKKGKKQQARPQTRQSQTRPKPQPNRKASLAEDARLYM